MSRHRKEKYFGNVSPRPSIRNPRTAIRGASEFASQIDSELKLPNHHSAAFSGAECFSDTFPTETDKSSVFRCEESKLPPNVNEETSKSKSESGNLNEWEANSEMVQTRSANYGAGQGKSKGSAKKDVVEAKASRDSDDVNGNSDSDGAWGDAGSTGAGQGKSKGPAKKDVGEAKASRDSDDVNGNSDSDGAWGDAGSTVRQDNELRKLKNKIQHSQTSNEEKRKRGKAKPQEEASSGSGIYGLLKFSFVLVLVALVGSAFLNVYKPKLPATDENPTLQAFQIKFKELKSRFPSQREELWKRSKILLEKHLLSAQPSEPASMILTSGQNAQKTLHCLASQLAGAYSSALNASAVQMDGSGLASLDSDWVKLLLDEKLKSSFEDNKRTAVIHRLEELPPGATLIFYKYCDHENAAYKAVALLFTVLLDEEELTPGLNLGTVEEKVRDYIQKKFINSEQPDAFNRMDADKLGGLWSRISHLILPVTAEMGIENHGCDSADSK